MQPRNREAIRPPQVNCRTYIAILSLSQIRHFYSSKEKKYAHYISEASWAGARIIQGQWTEQAQRLYDLIILVFSENGKLANLEALKKKSGVSDEEWEDLLQYSSQVRVRSRCSLFVSNAEIRS